MELEQEGRCLVTDHGAFVLFNVYGPAVCVSDADESRARFQFKLEFYQVCLSWLGLGANITDSCLSFRLVIAICSYISAGSGDMS